MPKLSGGSWRCPAAKARRSGSSEEAGFLKRSAIWRKRRGLLPSMKEGKWRGKMSKLKMKISGWRYSISKRINGVNEETHHQCENMSKRNEKLAKSEESLWKRKRRKKLERKMKMKCSSMKSYIQKQSKSKKIASNEEGRKHFISSWKKRKKLPAIYLQPPVEKPFWQRYLAPMKARRRSGFSWHLAFWRSATAGEALGQPASESTWLYGWLLSLAKATAAEMTGWRSCGWKHHNK